MGKRPRLRKTTVFANICTIIVGFGQNPLFFATVCIILGGFGPRETPGLLNPVFLLPSAFPRGNGFKRQLHAAWAVFDCSTQFWSLLACWIPVPRRRRGLRVLEGLGLTFLISCPLPPIVRRGWTPFQPRSALREHSFSLCLRTRTLHIRFSGFSDP